MEAHSSVNVDNDQFGCYSIGMLNIQATESDGIELLYRGRSLHGIPFQHVEHFNAHCDMLDVDRIVEHVQYSKQFQIPDHYAQLDVVKYIKSLAEHRGLAAQQRVQEELNLFESRNLLPVLQLLIYIVDTMRKHNTVWGVGRGSSVASYCLYLIGVHKVDSIKFELDIGEFLK